MSVRTVALLGLAMLVTAAPAQAATFTVTTTADTPGAAGCTATLCTVRTAIAAAAANGNTADDVIVLAAGSTYAVTAASGALTVPNGATRITIQGAGANSTAIQSPGTIRALVIGSSAGVTVTGVTLRGGTITSGQGGNVLVSSQATATFNRVRVTGGSAPQGGGIGVLGAGSLTIQSSLIDANTATGTALTAAGGGIYVQGQTTATPITIQDSTIASNSARNGGGIAIENNTGQAPVLRGVTLARNNARAGTPSGGAGGISSAATNARFQGSIVAGNTSTFNFGPGPQDLPSNCALASAATDDGGNVTPDSADQCGLGGVHTDPQLAAALDTSQPPALTIPSNSSAVDVAACTPRTVDQRGVTRPQGTACDAGAYEVDQAPTVTITSGPTGTVASATASFGFSTTEPGVSLQCRMTGPGQSGAFAACTSPTAQSYSGLGSGAYTFSVRALDGTFTNPPIASRSFTVDVTAPDTTLIPIASPTNDTTPTFSFSSEAGATFQCRVDTAAFATCTSPRTVPALSQGTHTFQVRAVDALGNADASPASQTFVVDTTAPNTTITGNPPATTGDNTPTFTFTATETGAFECAVDDDALTVCTSPFTTAPLERGLHTFTVRAVDTAGNADASPATVSFFMDATPPETTLAGDGPFEFTSPVTGATFECSLDDAAFAPCASPVAFDGLAVGEHTFTVRAVDAFGNVDATPERRTFTVLPPVVLPAATATPSPTATPAPSPVAGKSVGAKPVGGTVLVKLKGAKTFEPLSPSVIANGAEVDARKGIVEITRSDGGVAKFYDGIFKLSQSGGITTLTLSEKLTGCPKAKQSSPARAAAAKPKTRKLWGDGKGKFRTKGQYSAATVRGTKWLVQDTCTTTLTRVVRGVVAVEDFAKRKTILLKQGKRYTARPKR
ncbi:Ig-like domain-containing protein [Solirubrobacter ginsenosidimutans]|uniref:Ig-like domain-containing protein n=1 Tax=Solirubrobacter ginsenosidimutans TaxID=490573 RepID=A0A9X3N092_9ACTN|nr:Ig-like domain-containing protein [Solirubrobacter ginsenosidimutans]MDA0164688.1 Ig-like domain-containing protein [Solirubrobacter ginsenosidimutans]